MPLHNCDLAPNLPMLRHPFNPVLACLLLSGFAMGLPIAAAQADEAAAMGEQITEQLLGRWEIYQPGSSPPSGFPPVLVFTPGGELFFLPAPDSDIVRGSWSLDTLTPQLVVKTDLEGVLTWSSSGPDLMELQTEVLTSGELTIQARRVSDDVSLPAGRPIIEAADALASQVTVAREASARAGVGAVNRLQQATFLEQQQFEPDIQTINNQLGRALLPNPNYSYTVFIAEGAVTTVALPTQTELRAFVGRVAPVTADNDSFTRAILCQSDVPTEQMPELPDELVCPTGYGVTD